MTGIKTKALHGNIRKYVKSLKRQDWVRDRPSLYTDRDWRHTIPLDTGAIFICKTNLSDTTFRLVVWGGEYHNGIEFGTREFLIHPKRSRLSLPLFRHVEVADKFEELTRHVG